MITTENYYARIANVDQSTLPKTLSDAWKFVEAANAAGDKPWDLYHGDPEIKKTTDLYFEKLETFLAGDRELQSITIRDKKPKSQKKRESDASKISHGIAPERPAPDLVEIVPDDVRLVKRFLLMNGKEITKPVLPRYINALQKAILEKKIRKTSPHAALIKDIQAKVIRVFNTMDNGVTFTIVGETLDQCRKAVGELAVFPSIALLKRYMSINGKIDVGKRAESLFNAALKATNNGTVSAEDPYMSNIKDMIRHLKNYIRKNDPQALEIDKNELRGLEGILGCSCKEEEPTLISSVDFSGKSFDTIGFTGKWYDLMGDPAPGFVAMISGPPKWGKTILSTEWAGDLARHHGPTLYISFEERLGKTFHDKVVRPHIQHPNLYVSETLPDDLSKFKFVFLDSVTSMGLSPEQLNDLRRRYPRVSFIFIFQVTKNGVFRGANTFKHDVDIVMELDKKGHVVQMGRYNQGGEMNIFPLSA